LNLDAQFNPSGCLALYSPVAPNRYRFIGGYSHLVLRTLLCRNILSLRTIKIVSRETLQKLKNKKAMTSQSNYFVLNQDFQKILNPKNRNSDEGHKLQTCARRESVCGNKVFIKFSHLFLPNIRCVGNKPLRQCFLVKGFN